MRTSAVSTLVLIILCVCASPTFASPIFIGLGDFSGSETVINFNSIPDEALITAQYAGSGVTFSDALYGMTHLADLELFPSNGGGVIASNWLYSQGRNDGLSFTADFSTMMTRVGFYLENWSNQTATVELFDGLTSLGFITHQTASLTAEFLGVQDSRGFNRIVFTNTSDTNGFYAIDDFRFEPGSTIPEPTSLLLLGTGLAGLALAAWRRKK